MNYWDKIREVYRELLAADPTKSPRDLWTEAYKIMKEQGHQ